MTVDLKSWPIEFIVEADQSVMKTGLYLNDFSKAFSKLLEKSGVSRYSIAEFTGLDEGYLSKLYSDERNSPSPETVMKICLALARFSDKVSLYDLNELFTSMGRMLLNKHGSN